MAPIDLDNLIKHGTDLIDGVLELVGTDNHREREIVAKALELHAKQRAGVSRTLSGRIRFPPPGSDPPQT